MKWTPSLLRTNFEEAVWRTPGESLPRARAWLLRGLQIGVVLARDLAQGQLTLRAMGLVYTTLLSIVPLLALSFSVLKAFGVYNKIRPMLLGFLEPLGEKGVEITARIVQFIEKVNVGVLGTVGLALLLYTAVSLVQKIEEAFNFIWHVSRARGLGERFSRYVSALMVGPLLVFSAIGITAALANFGFVREAMELEAIGWLAEQAGRMVPYLLVIGAFTFIYSFMPNTRVRFWPALAGGAVGGILWQSAGWGFALFAASSTNYAAIYSGFAVLILFMLWLYLNWLILLFGASVAFYVQHPEYLFAKGGEPQLSNRMRERLALVIMSLVAQRHLEGGPPLSADALAQALRMPMRAIDRVLAALQAGALLAPTAEEPPGWLPVRDLSQISVKGLLDAVRAAGEDRFFNPEALPGGAAVEEALRRGDQAADHALRETSIRDLAAQETGKRA